MGNRVLLNGEHNPKGRVLSAVKGAEAFTESTGTREKIDNRDHS